MVALLPRHGIKRKLRDPLFNTLKAGCRAIKLRRGYGVWIYCMEGTGGWGVRLPLVCSVGTDEVFRRDGTAAGASGVCVSVLLQGVPVGVAPLCLWGWECPPRAWDTINPPYGGGTVAEVASACL